MPPPTARGMGTVCCALQYHASYPRDKRLVQPGLIGNVPGAAWLVAWVSCFQITEILLFIGRYLLGIAIVSPDATAGRID